MNRPLAALAVLGIAAGCLAQTPDVAIFSELRPSVTFQNGERPLLRWYDIDGRSSVVGFKLALENGSRVKVSQRLQRIPGDPDPLDEYFIDLRSEWKIGKQYIPFGRRMIVREALPAVSFNTSLVFDGLPIEIAAFDGGKNYPRGVSFRAGRSVGISAGIGNHLVIQGSSLTPFQHTSDAAGKGRGYRAMYGLDATLAMKGWNLGLEWVSLREAETALDGNQDLSDIRARIKFSDINTTIEAGWARSWIGGTDTFRLGAEVSAGPKATILPTVRFDKRGFKDICLSAFIKL